MEVSNQDPAHARARGIFKLSLIRPQWRIDVETQSHVSSTAETLHVVQQLNVSFDHQPFFQRRWLESIPRHLI